MARPTDTKKRRHILESAFRVFGEQGFQSSTIKSIARKAGIAPGSIYTYFRDKEELFNSTVNETWERILGDFKAIVESPRSIADRLADLIDAGFSTLKSTLPLLRGMLFEAARNRQFQENLRALCGHIERLLAEGSRQGLIELREDSEQWRKVVEVTTTGILFSAALSSEDGTDREIASLKTAISRMLFERIAKEPPAGQRKKQT